MSIQVWPSEDRPREKLMMKGAAALTDAELLAIFFRAGVAGKSAVDLARESLERAGSLAELVSQELLEFSAVKGLGEAKYVQLKAAMELGTRILKSRLGSKAVFHDCDVAKDYLRLKSVELKHEIFGLLLLNSQNQLLADIVVSEGGANRASVIPQVVARKAIQCHASKVILYHNHPSGNPEPSQSDIDMTLSLCGSLKLLDIIVLDHLVVGHSAVVSMKQRALF